RRPARRPARVPRRPRRAPCRADRRRPGGGGRRPGRPPPRRRRRVVPARRVAGGDAVTVYLVGAGPGDPGLLTVRGAEVLASADVVVYDRLSVASLLELAPAQAERISVGKAPGRATVTQAESNALLVERAGGGLDVVRLKGGD